METINREMIASGISKIIDKYEDDLCYVLFRHEINSEGEEVEKRIDVEIDEFLSKHFAPTAYFCDMFEAYDCVGVKIYTLTYGYVIDEVIYNDILMCELI